MVLLSHLSLTFYPHLHAFSGEASPKVHPMQFLIHESPFGFFFSGTAAVFIFFVLSGYILTKAALKGGGGVDRIISMSLKRYPRLMIPALASCLVAYAGFVIFDISSPELGDWIVRYASYQDHSLFGSLRSGMVDVFVSGESPYNPILWTMKIELLGSLMVYMLCLNRLALKSLPLLRLIFIAILSGILLDKIDESLGLGLISFLGGYLFCIYGREIPSKIALPCVIIGLYLAGAHNTSSSYSFIRSFLGDKTYMLSNFASGFVLVYVIIFCGSLNNIFSGRISVFMGKVSFSVYLIHLPIIATLGLIVFNYIFELTGSYNISALLTSVVLIPLIYAVSLCFYRLVDLKSVAISSIFANYTISSFWGFAKAVQRTLR